jgi:hypothetical protein
MEIVLEAQLDVSGLDLEIFSGMELTDIWFIMRARVGNLINSFGAGLRVLLTPPCPATHTTLTYTMAADPRCSSL